MKKNVFKTKKKLVKLIKIPKIIQSIFQKKLLDKKGQEKVMLIRV